MLEQVCVNTGTGLRQYWNRFASILTQRQVMPAGKIHHDLRRKMQRKIVDLGIAKKLLDQGVPKTKIAQSLGISRSTLLRCLQRKELSEEELSTEKLSIMDQPTPKQSLTLTEQEPLPQDNDFEEQPNLDGLDKALKELNDD